MASLPNIYKSKNLKFFIAVPLVLLVISILLSPRLVLDSSLAGGAIITVSTNTSLSSQQIASEVGAALHVPAPSVVKSAGSVTITLAANSSISNAYDYLLAFSRNQSAYGYYYANYTNAEILLSNASDSTSASAAAALAKAGMVSSLSNMGADLSNELALLKPFYSAPQYNSSDPSQMGAIAQDAYTNASLVYQQSVIKKLELILPSKSQLSYEPTAPQEGKAFLSSLEQIIIVAFILVSIVVFVIFRSIIPSITVIFGAANDIIIAIGAMALLGIPLGISSIGGLLMLLGYSIDTDLLTSIRILKRHEGTPEDRAYSSMKTGITMTGAAIASFAVLFVVSFIAYIPTYYEIAGVVLFGLIGDLATTWLGNASLILMYVKRKGKV
ncbi:MAG: hypothetical protein QXF01_02760 [Candidatus Micrarchaeaceae archaeon]